MLVVMGVICIEAAMSSLLPGYTASSMPTRTCQNSFQIQTVCGTGPERWFLPVERPSASSQHLLETRRGSRTIESVGIHAAVPLIAAIANIVILVATLSQGVSQRVIRIF